MDLEHKRTRIRCDLGGNGKRVLYVLLCENGHARGNAADQGKRNAPAIDVLYNLSRFKGGSSIGIEELDGARFGLVALEQAVVFECVEMRVHGGRGGEPHSSRHLANARRIALLKLIGQDVVVDLLLALSDLAGHGRAPFVAWPNHTRC